ncbi:MAG: ABC transporter ATP-binding protein [Gammaproteobacteria bacterium]|nr:ABC transporter ATP-binding protein [Gammaproteobacteria bacterium]
MTELIRLEKLQRTFAQGETELPVLKDLSLTIQDGESLAIVGPSGSGKSTLLSILGLLDDATGGHYWLRGEDVNQLTRQQKSFVRNRHLGWIFQNFNLIGDMTALENVVLPMRYNSDIPSSDYQSRAEALLQRVGLGHKLNALPSELSGGQQQRVAIARALVNKPSLLLADEPTGNLDSGSGQSIVDLLLELSTEGATVILVTHNPDVAEQCQRTIHLVDGVITNASQ